MEFMTDKSNDLIESYESFINKVTTLSNKLDNLNLSSIKNNKVHYLCTKCFKFPYIKFCKDKRFIRLTCSCLNNKKILIKEYFKIHNISIESSYTSSLNSNNYKDIENKLLCQKHKAKYKGFSKLYLDNYCESCIYSIEDNNIIIRFDDIKIKKKKNRTIIKKNK